MKILHIFLAGASLLGLGAAAHAFPAREEIVGSVCGACAPGQSPDLLALELQYTQMFAHDPATRRDAIVNQPPEISEGPISARY